MLVLLERLDSTQLPVRLFGSRFLIYHNAFMADGQSEHKSLLAFMILF